MLVDLRLHGESQDFDPPHTVRACGEDVVGAIHELPLHNKKKVIVGHSFGGKVALEVARLAPDLLSEIWLIDSFPGLSARHGDAWKMIEWLQKNEGPFTTRTEVLKKLKEAQFPEAIAAWMATNLEPEGKLLKWIFPVKGIASLLDDYAKTDLTDTLLNPPCPIHVVKGTKSPLITDDLIQKIQHSKTRFPISLHFVEAGHWVHSENPKELLRIMMSSFKG